MAYVNRQTARSQCALLTVCESLRCENTGFAGIQQETRGGVTSWPYVHAMAESSGVGLWRTGRKCWVLGASSMPNTTDLLPSGRSVSEAQRHPDGWLKWPNLVWRLRTICERSVGIVKKYFLFFSLLVALFHSCIST